MEEAKYKLVQVGDQGQAVDSIPLPATNDNQAVSMSKYLRTRKGMFYIEEISSARIIFGSKPRI